ASSAKWASVRISSISFYLAVCLRVFNRAKALVDTELCSRLFEFAIRKLGSIIRNED
ncbi:hypothetical protein PIB30_111427, partial [Stylosanthes scabra]|nr:hypothetical protein [Stylosanthes scabra]